MVKRYLFKTLSATKFFQSTELDWVEAGLQVGLPFNDVLRNILSYFHIHKQWKILKHLSRFTAILLQTPSYPHPSWFDICTIYY